MTQRGSSGFVNDKLHLPQTHVLASYKLAAILHAGKCFIQRNNAADHMHLSCHLGADS